MTSSQIKVGVVVIGRNEGERLKRCLHSLVTEVSLLIYVDSGSIDDSVLFARSLGVQVVELDPAQPFSMARGRNAGFFQLLQVEPDLEFVQFVDGDCEMQPGWIKRAQHTLATRTNVAVVAGRRMEGKREASVYNRLCDLEWDAPIGEAMSCHGDAMIRVKALRQAGLFKETMIAGEEAELCVRLRQAEWKILRLDAPMTIHDAAITRFSQWWRRAQRAGYAYAEGAALHGLTKERHNVRPLMSILFWGLALPATATLLAWSTQGLSVVLLLGYGVLWYRVVRSQNRRGRSIEDARLYATFVIIGKIAQMLGVLRFGYHRLLLQRHGDLIEYKSRPS